MADKNRQHEKDNKDAESGEPVQLDRDQQQKQRTPQQQDAGNEAGGMEQGARPAQHEGGHKK